MSSLPTISNRFEKQGTGDNAGNWGIELNRALDNVDESLDGITTVPVGSSDVTLASTNFVSDQARRRLLKCTGTGGANVIIPGVPKWYLVHNACAAAVTIKTASRPGVAIQPAVIAVVYCDGASCAQLSGLWPLVDGTAAAPGLYFANDISTGLYRVGAGTIGVTCGGSQVLSLAAGALSVSFSGTQVLSVAPAAVSIAGNLAIERNVNGPLTSSLKNVSPFSGADAYYLVTNGVAGADGLRVGYRGAAQTTYGALAASSGYLYLNAAPLVLMADSPSGTLRFASGGNTETGRNTTSGGFTTWRFGLSSYAFSASIAAVSIGYGGSGNQYGITMLPQVDTTTAIEFKNSFGTTVGSISQTASATAYNTSSDYRLKDNISDLDCSAEFIAGLRPVRFTWKADGTPSVGFIADEVAEISPSSVTGEKDALDAAGQPLYQGMQPGSPEIMANVVAELQRLGTELQAANARLATLEARV